MGSRARHVGFTVLELAISLAMVSLLLAILLPALASARVVSHREQCAGNQRCIGEAWQMYLDDHDGEFPYIPIQGGWRYGGVRFSSVDSRPFPDTQRPLTPYVPQSASGRGGVEVFRCPADRGITGETTEVGTADRTAYRAFGTSYRANALLLDADRAGIEGVHRGLRVGEVSTVASRLVVMGDPIWFEVRERTGRNAVWHGETERGNLLFLDGSVRSMQVLPKPRVGPAVYEPKLLRDLGLPEVSERRDEPGTVKTGGMRRAPSEKVVRH